MVIENQAVRIEARDSRLAVFAPYNPEFPTAAKRLGGRFEGTSKAWLFDARDERRVRDLCVSVYGTDGATEIETVAVRVLVRGGRGGQTVHELGRELAYRPGRDAAVRLGQGVVIEEGSRGFPGRGGSAKNPKLGNDEPVCLLVRDVPKSLADAAITENPWEFALEGAEFAKFEAESVEQKRAEAMARVESLREQLAAAEAALAGLNEGER